MCIQKIIDWFKPKPPVPPVPPIPPIPPDPPDPPPPPPVVVTCDIPYHKTWKLLIYSGTILTDLCTKDNVLFKEEWLPAYFDALVRDGVNAIRSFSSCNDSTPNWPIWRMDEPGYFDILRRRLGMLKERELTAILTLTPYGIPMLAWDDYRKLISVGMEFWPNVVFEPVNEPVEHWLQEQLYGIMRNEYNIPDQHIQFNFVDSGEFGERMLAMEGRGLASCHRVATMETINAPYPTGWAGSSGTMKLMSLGMGGSNDGDDAAGASRGLYFWGLNPISRRPTVEQLQECAAWMLANGKAYEHLSAVAFQSQEEPDVRALIEGGRAERLAMAAALK